MPENNIRLENKWLIASLILGLCEALRNKAMPFDLAGTLLFWPFSMSKLEKNGYDQELIDLLHTASELEDIDTHVPENFQDAIKGLEKDTILYMKKLGTEFDVEQRWFDKIF